MGARREGVEEDEHEVYGRERNDLVLQLRTRGVSEVVLAGMSANLWLESHLRRLQEQGLEVADATAAARRAELATGMPPP